MIRESEKSKIYSQQAKTQENRWQFQSEFEGSKISMSYFKKLNRKIFTEFLAVPSFFFFFLFKPTTDWMKSTHIREGNLHFNL